MEGHHEDITKEDFTLTEPSHMFEGQGWIASAAFPPFQAGTPGLEPLTQ